VRRRSAPFRSCSSLGFGLLEENRRAVQRFARLCSLDPPPGLGRENQPRKKQNAILAKLVTFCDPHYPRPSPGINNAQHPLTTFCWRSFLYTCLRPRRTRPPGGSRSRPAPRRPLRTVRRLCLKPDQPAQEGLRPGRRVGWGDGEPHLAHQRVGRRLISIYSTPCTCTEITSWHRNYGHNCGTAIHIGHNCRSYGRNSLRPPVIHSQDRRKSRFSRVDSAAHSG